MKRYIQAIDQYYYNGHTRKMGKQLCSLILERNHISKIKVQNFLIQVYQNKKPSTYKTYYAFLSSFLNKLKKDGLTGFMIQDINLPMLRGKEQIAPSLTKRVEKEDLNLFLTKLREEKKFPIYYFILLLSSSGLRTQEAKDIDISPENRIDVQGDFWVYYILGKGGKYRQCYLPKDLVIEIQKCLGNQPFRDLRFPTMFLKRFAIKWELKVFTPHQLRSYYGTTLLEKNHMPINLVAQLLGHASVSTTARYYLRNKIDTKQLVI